MNHPRVHIETFGCQMNEYDSELVRSLLKQEGFVLTDVQEAADVVLMNTCAIREHAHTRVYGHLAELKAIKRQRPLVVGILGCMAQNLKKDLTDAQPIVDLLVGPDGYRQLPGMLRKAWQGLEEGDTGRQMAVDLSEYETYEGILPDRTPGVNAWIAVMRGCDNFCTFCVVPYTRGRERSRDPESILHETRLLADQGHRQVTLLGQNVNSYRSDGWDFARLIIAVADVPGIERVRFTSPHPKDFPQSLLDAIAQHPRICKHIHLPLQAGNDRILALMDRTYTRREYLDLVKRIRRAHPRIALTTDLICGFCSESDGEFEDTLSAVEAVRFHSAFVFKYSERKNTIAARKHPDDVPESVKGDRVGRLVEAQRRISLALARSRIGQTVSVLVEGTARKSAAQWMGKTDDNLTVVWDKTKATNTIPGQFRQIFIEGATAATLLGCEAPTVSAD
ncbi:MAG: tRNA (N6-isopentenyl adenosine(37)-C2)-methylthiotransferase MiaB [Nitrospiraceae bacterium]